MLFYFIFLLLFVLQVLKLKTKNSEHFKADRKCFRRQFSHFYFILFYFILFYFVLFYFVCTVQVLKFLKKKTVGILKQI